MEGMDSVVKVDHNTCMDSRPDTYRGGQYQRYDIGIHRMYEYTRAYGGSVFA